MVGVDSTQVSLRRISNIIPYNIDEVVEIYVRKQCGENIEYADANNSRVLQRITAVNDVNNQLYNEICGNENK